jgi:hypothetical protein
MKKFLALAAVLAGLTGYSQSTTESDTMESQIQRLQDSRIQELITMGTEKPNEIRRGNVSYSGALVQFLKSDNKLQLINPAAPADYGSGRDNLVEDRSPELGLSPTTGNSAREGLKLFSIQF